MAYIGKQPVVGNFVKLDAIVTSATATYNLLNGGVAYSPQSANNCIVSLNGIIQEPTSSGNVGGYTISGSTIVFTSALTSNDVIDFILVLGDVLNIGTPSDATVGFAKVTSNLITGATSESTIAGGDSVLIYDDSASALRKMTRTNFVSGLGGLLSSTAFSAYRTTSITLSDSTFTTVVFDSEFFDSNSAFNTSTGVFTVPTTGNYLLGVNINFSDAQGNNSDHIFTLNINGTDYYLARSESTSNGTLFTEFTQSWIGVKNLTASDAVKINVYIDTNDSSSSEIEANSNFQNQFWGVLIN